MPASESETEATVSGVMGAMPALAVPMLRDSGVCDALCGPPACAARNAQQARSRQPQPCFPG